MIATAATPAKPRRPLLRRLADLHCLLFHVLLLFAYGCAFALYLHPAAAHLEGPWSRTAFVLACTLMLGWSSGIDVAVNFHNHAHSRMFNRPWLNRWVGRLWTFSGGWPSFFFEHAHVVVHHANLLGARDWTVPRRRPDGRFESILSYSLLHWPWRFARHFWQDFRAGRGGSRVGRKALRELAIFLVLWSIPFWIDAKMALLLWLLPQWFGNVMLMGGGMYAQHAGCVEKSADEPYHHANTTLSPWLNLTMFNLGYHIEHHDHPNIHWTRLPELHVKLRGDMQKHGARVFRIGYHRMASVLGRIWSPREKRDRFLASHPSYRAPGELQDAPFDLVPADFAPPPAGADPWLRPPAPREAWMP